MSRAEPPAVGAQIRAARKAKGLSLRSLGELAGVRHATIDVIEQGGNCQIEVLHRIISALGIDVVLHHEATPPEVRPNPRAQRRAADL